MTDPRNRLRSLALDVARMVGVVGLLTVVLAAGIHGAAGGVAATVPSAEFDYRYDAAADTLTVTHARGDPLAAEAVRVAGVDATCTSDAWASGMVAADDTCVLSGVGDRSAVRVVWDGDDGTRAVLDVWAGRYG